MFPTLRRLAETIGLLRRPDDRAGSATRPLRILLVCSVVIPVLVFIAAAVISYRQHFDDARDRLRRNVAIVHEHAQKVFETFEFAARYLDEVTGDLSDARIRASEAVISERLRAMTQSMPQLRDLWIVGADGQPLVSGTIFPMPSMDLSDRDYFRVHKERLVEGAFVSEVMDARAASTRFFAISRKREINRRFSGVTIVSIASQGLTDGTTDQSEPAMTLAPVSSASLIGVKRFIISSPTALRTSTSVIGVRYQI